MTIINSQIAIDNMVMLQNKPITYSMEYPRTGISPYNTGDCSGTVYDSLRKAGATNAGWVLNTDSMHDWLLKNGYRLVAKNIEYKITKKGTIFILGERGSSGGSYGHTGIFTGRNEDIIHCNGYYNGVTVENFDVMYNRSIKFTPQLKTWYFYEPPTEQPNVSTKFIVGQSVKILNHASNYQTGEKIPNWVKNKNYKILQIKNVSQSNSKKAYLLSDIISWVLEQDLG